MTVSFNSPSFNFKGKYIISGNVKDVRKCDKKITNEYFKGFNNKFESFKKENCLNDFYDLEAFSLTGSYNENQEYSEYLFTTNEDNKPFRNYMKKRDNITPLNPNATLKELEESLSKEIERLTNEIAPFNEAQKSKDGSSNFLIDLYQKARKTTEEIFGKKEAEQIKILKSQDVLKAIDEDRFDFIDGVIKAPDAASEAKKAIAKPVLAADIIDRSELCIFSFTEKWKKEDVYGKPEYLQKVMDDKNIDKTQAIIDKLLDAKNDKEIFEALGAKVVENSDKTLTVLDFDMPFKYEELGIDEEELYKRVR